MAHSGDFAASTIEWGTTPDSITLLQLMKDILGITDASRDTELSLHLQAGGEACEKYIDNKIAEVQVDENFSHARNQVALRYYPVSAVGAVFVDGTNEITDYLEFDDEGLKWVVGSQGKCCLEINQCFSSLLIRYTCGYEPLPADLGYAVVMTAMSYESERGAVSGAVKKEVVTGVGSIEYSTGDDISVGVGLIPPAAIGTLDLYRRHNV